MHTVIGTIAAILVCALVPGPAIDQRSAGAGRSGTAAHWASQVRRVTLDNGLTVLLLQRGTLPIVSVEALYRVGSRNERPGLTGAAHFIEHMAFRRTTRINKGDLTNQVLRWGGRWSGYTSYDQTVYNQHAPSAFLDWLLFTERQRLAHVIFDGPSVELERTSVISELREYENSPSYVLAEHRLRRAAMVAHPYGSPIMGWISDLEAVTPADLERFYREHYAANNLVLAIVGRFDEAEALALVRRHFDDAPGGGRSTRLITEEPVQAGARRVVHRGPGAASHLELLVHAPAIADARYPTLLVLDAVLAGGKAEGRADADAGSRLHTALVDPGLAHFVTTEVELPEYPGLYAVGIRAGADADLGAIEGVLNRALAAAGTEVSDAEVAAASARVLAAFALRDDSNRSIADQLARFEGIGGYELLPRTIDAVGRVTAEDVRALAAELFAPERHNVGWFMPEPAPAPARTTEAGREAAAPAAVAQRHEGTVTPPTARLDLPALPAVSLTTLDNGLTVGVAPLGGDLVHVRVRVDAGSSSDPPGREGLAVVTARAITEHGAAPQASLPSSAGIQVASSASSVDDVFDNRAYVEWTAVGRRGDLETLLSTLARQFTAPAVRPDAVSRIAKELAGDLDARQDDSRWRANDAAWQALFPPGHLLGRPVYGTRASLDAIDADDVTRFLAARYQPGRATVVVAGAVTTDDAVAAVTEAFGGWKPVAASAVPDERPRAAATVPTARGDGRDVHVEMPHKEQASITVALPAEGPTGDAYPALSLLNYLLGETGYAGRLGEQLVDTGLAYAVYASLWPHRGDGALVVTTDAVRSRETVARMRSTLAAFARDGVTAAQLDEARGFVLGRLLFRFETPASASATVADLASLGLGDRGLQAFAERVRQVTVAEVNAAAARFYDPARAVFVVAGR